MDKITHQVRAEHWIKIIVSVGRFSPFRVGLKTPISVNWIYQCAESACPVFWKSTVRKGEIIVPDR